ncbi:MAG: hypothetical protein J6N52_03980 [Clostridia bacterium]|nr:hypothetical protein [Clostridia bacterium]
MYNFGRNNFSARGSYLSIDNCENGFRLSTIRGWKGGVYEIFRVVYDKMPDISFTPWEMSVSEGTNVQNFCFFGSDGLYFKGKGSGITLEYCEYPDTYIANYVIKENGSVNLCDYKNDCFEWLTPKKGSIEIEAPRKKGEVKCDYIKLHIIPDDNGEFEAALEQFFSPSSVLRCYDYSYDDCVNIQKKDYTEWEKKFDTDNEYQKECAYVIWSNIVNKGGNFTYDSVIMSKAGMSAVWTWDNCINALGIADKDFELAMGQFLMPYDNMDEFGCLPDSICDSVMSRAYVKPPIQGWIYKHMIERDKRFARRENLARVYSVMKKNTDWWLNFRGETPFYTHGNDSGADNATCFDKSERIETSELLAFLSIQCDFLSETARILGMHTDKRVYKMLADELAQKAIDGYWDGRIFVRDAVTKEPYYSDSLMPLRMIVLKDKLPVEIRDYIIEKIKDHHLSVNGIASEAYDSPLFEKNGYWRGAVWAPDQVIIITALREMGYTQLADEAAGRYKHALEVIGFNENISAVSMEALRCKSYTWTASAYLYLGDCRMQPQCGMQLQCGMRNA